MITIDGSYGEGGGQILRTALALSLVTGKPFEITKIRAGRRKPGLMQQHLTALNAARRIGDAEVDGNTIGSAAFRFIPKSVRPGSYHFSVGTAGSCTLVLQAILPALLTADGPSRIDLEGGTHNPFAPPFDFLEKAFLPLICRMGPTVSAQLGQPGFYPAGGGRFSIMIRPVKRLKRLDLLTRGAIRKRTARAIVAKLPGHIAARELKVVRESLSWPETCLQTEAVPLSRSPGNVLIIEVESEHITEVFTGFGQRGVPAERVAAGTVREVRDYLAADVPAGRHLADQLLLPLSLAGGGRFRTLKPTRHTETNAQIIQQFLDVETKMSRMKRDVWEISVAR
ncbi:RNA 3'-terminal phosphate cyclase [Desulfonema ishimotonii]|uniref:RNA 3'-terminal phosphate cyclase n=1 Tax=Desulfonema ishimotonii TaxID=45657 RepID=A0A401FWB9_9BACT|nr:RNA 3'-terminal phosphate cyclase [Desulfonema ishimotonii]GBC61267.1 RNA 3'-terminal phosphate cyclase [Desulfonema ishimotonii]